MDENTVSRLDFYAEISVFSGLHFAFDHRATRLVRSFAEALLNSHWRQE